MGDQSKNEKLPMNVGEEIPQKRRNYWSLVMSLVLHAGLFVLLALFFTRAVPMGETEGTRRVAVVLATPDKADRFEYEESPDTPDSESDPTHAVEPLPDQQPPVDSSMPQVENVPLDQNQQVFDAGTWTQVPNKSKGENSKFELTEAQLEQLAKERAMLNARKPKGSPTSLSVFGSGQMKGRSFVFVLDRSNSMGEQGLGVLQRAADQLQDAVNKLETDHRFQIIAYHHKTEVVQKRALLRATETNKKKVREFVGKLAAFGGTEHESALISALSFKPDAIVLLTDGGYPPLNESQLAMIKRIARNSRTQIHCVMFGTGPLQDDDNFMAKLAIQNQGSFKYINVDRWSIKK